MKEEKPLKKKNQYYKCNTAIYINTHKCETHKLKHIYLNK